MGRTSQVQQARRMLNLIQHLSKAHTKLNIESLAQEFNVSTKLMQEDLMRLACCGVDDIQRINLFTSNNEAVIWSGLPQVSQALRLSHKETQALCYALSLAGIDNNDPLYQKLLHAGGSPEFKSHDLEQRLHYAQTKPQANLMNLINQAAADKRVALISYSSTSDLKALKSVRAIEAHQVFFADGRWYLEAWCRKAKALRTFRLDRIKEFKLLDEHFDAEKIPVEQLRGKYGLPLEQMKRQIKDDKNKLDYAYLAFYSDSVLQEFDWPYLEILSLNHQKASQLFFESNLLERDERPLFFARIPLFPNRWLARQITACLAEVAALAPKYLIDLVYQETCWLIEQADRQEVDKQGADTH